MDRADDLADVDVVYFAAIDWGFRFQNHQYIATGIARHGGRVIFVENTGVRWPRPRDIARVAYRIVRAVQSAPRSGASREGGVVVLTPYVLPVSGTRILRALNAALLRWQIRRARRRLGGLRRLIAWIGLPNWTSLDTTRALRPSAVVYFCPDEFGSVPGVHRSMRESEPAAFRTADAVFATSRRLGDIAAAHGTHAILIPNGVDSAEFALDREVTPLPNELRGCRGRLIGYMGGLNHKVDVALLDRVALAFPEDTLVVLGNVEDPRRAPAAAPSVRILGSRPHHEVPRYVAHFDVCLIPYLLTEFTASVYPAKLNEYLAAGRPVVSTALPEVLPFASAIGVARDHDEFIALVRRALDEPDTSEARAARRRIARRSEWSTIVDGMIHEVLARTSTVTARD